MAGHPDAPSLLGVTAFDDDRLGHLLEVLSRASIGDLDVRAEVDPQDLDDPLGVVANAVNVLLDDLAYRQREREAALAVATEARAKEEFLAYLSHDMQTPLALLLGTLRLLESSPTADELATALPIMQRAAGRLQRFVQQFLDLARLGADRPLLVQTEAVDLTAVIQRATRLLADKGTATVALPADLPSARADAGRVEQIIANLLTNAFTYAGADATVTVSAEAVADGRVAVHVTDDGVGMTPQDLRTAFERYERGSTSEGTAGTGLGLYLSRALAEAQDGTLEAVSEAGRGTRFTLVLPRWSDPR